MLQFHKDINYANLLPQESGFEQPNVSGGGLPGLPLSGSSLKASADMSTGYRDTHGDTQHAAETVTSEEWSVCGSRAVQSSWM